MNIVSDTAFKGYNGFTVGAYSDSILRNVPGSLWAMKRLIKRGKEARMDTHPETTPLFVNFMLHVEEIFSSSLIFVASQCGATVNTVEAMEAFRTSIAEYLEFATLAGYINEIKAQYNTSAIDARLSLLQMLITTIGHISDVCAKKEPWSFTGELFEEVETLPCCTKS
jgi:hypothetical protein